MSLPHLLLVDDSEAILAFERAALSDQYLLSAASNGVEALVQLARHRPDAVLMDLSMPQMDGDEVVARMRADPALSTIPVIVVSAEKARAEACLRLGAEAFLPKPIDAAELRALVARVLEEARRRRLAGSLAILPIGVGGVDLGIPLEAVRVVLPQLLTQPLPMGSHLVGEVFEHEGEPVCVLDLARRFGVAHAVPLEERKLVVVGRGGRTLALCVDDVRDPEEIAAANVTPRERIGAGEHRPLATTLIAVARSSRGSLPVIEPFELLSRALWRKLPEAVAAAASRREPSTERT